MVKSSKANNSHYFKAFNEDYKCGGRYHDLDNSEFRIMVILQSYADSSGNVRMINGKGYDTAILCKMVGLNYRTIKRGLLSLAQRELIKIGEDMTITLWHFIDDNVYRGTTKISKVRKDIAEQTVRNANMLENIENELCDSIVVKKETGEIINRSVKV